MNLTSFFNNRGHRRVPNYEFQLLFCVAVFTLATKIILTAKSMRRSSRSTSLFSFVTRHSLIVIRLLLHRQLKLPILQKELSEHGNSNPSTLEPLPRYQPVAICSSTLFGNPPLVGILRQNSELTETACVANIFWSRSRVQGSKVKGTEPVSDYQSCNPIDLYMKNFRTKSEIRSRLAGPKSEILYHACL